MSEIFYSIHPGGGDGIFGSTPQDDFPFETPPVGCGSLVNPSYTNFLFSIFILLGILVSYLPQHHRIVSRKSSEGISPFFLLLGVTSGTCTFLNILILSKGVLGCCRWIGGFNCFAAGLGVLQVGVQWTCFAVILLLFLIYFPREASPLPTSIPTTPATAISATSALLSSASDLSANGLTPPSHETLRTLVSTTHPSPTTALAIAFLCVLHFIVHLLLALFLSQSSLPRYASILGIQAAILASIQYIPQIYTTWKLQHVGSFSIPMMLIQTPGSFVWAISLATREGTEWSSWVTYVVTGVLQGCLLAICLFFEWREKKAKEIAAAGYGAVTTGDVGGLRNAVGGVNGARGIVGMAGVDVDGDDDERGPLLGRRGF
ncbi:hypothetical protein DFH27DRAFT_312285 [Peziza echinospora]|nr:hypothetical protein DFH27DRAFT_312285 [Peziza echinospora]